MQCFTLHLVLLSTLLSTATCNTGKKNRNLFGVYVYDDLGTGSSRRVEQRGPKRMQSHRQRVAQKSAPRLFGRPGQRCGRCQAGLQTPRQTQRHLPSNDSNARREWRYCTSHGVRHAVWFSHVGEVVSCKRRCSLGCRAVSAHWYHVRRRGWPGQLCSVEKHVRHHPRLRQANQGGTADAVGRIYFLGSVRCLPGWSSVVWEGVGDWVGTYVAGDPQDFRPSIDKLAQFVNTSTNNAKVSVGLQMGYDHGLHCDQYSTCVGSMLWGKGVDRSKQKTLADWVDQVLSPELDGLGITSRLSVDAPFYLESVAGYMAFQRNLKNGRLACTTCTSSMTKGFCAPGHYMYSSLV